MREKYQQAVANFKAATGLESAHDLFKDRAISLLHYGVVFPNDHLANLYIGGIYSDFHEYGRYTPLVLEGGPLGRIMIDPDVLDTILRWGDVVGHSFAGDLFASHYDGRDTVHLQWQTGQWPEYFIADFDDLRWLHNKLKPVLSYYPDPTLHRHPEMAHPIVLDQVRANRYDPTMKPSRDRHEEGDPRFPGGRLIMDAIPISSQRFHYLHYEEYGLGEYGRFGLIHLSAWRDCHLVETAAVYPDVLLRGRQGDVQFELTWPERVVYGVAHRPNGVYVYNARTHWEDGLHEKHHVHFSRDKFEWLCRCLEPLKEGDPARYYKETE